MNKLSHNQRLLNYFQRYETINPLEAWSKLGIYRLGARIFDLRAAGHVINRRMIDVQNRFGEVCRVAQYQLQDK